jgi:hypothetical protein
MELYLSVLISVISISVSLGLVGGYNLYKNIKENEVLVEQLKIVIVENIEVITRDRSDHKV